MKDILDRGVCAPIKTAPPQTVLDQWNELAKDQQKRIALARRSIAFFAFYYLRQRGRPISVPRCHIEWYREIGGGDGYRRKPYQQRKRLLLAPRSHGKSLVAAYVVPLHRIVFNRNIRVLLISKKQDGAIKRLRRIRKQLEANPRIIEDFGGSEGFRDPTSTWTDHMFQVRRDDHSLVDPTLEAAGAGGAITGGRFDIIIADDPEDNETVLSAHMRARTREWFKATVQELLEPWGEGLVIGCLTGDTPVLMADGAWKPIVEVNPGEKVWSVDEAGRSGPREVQARLDQGVADIVKVSTTRHSVRATGWHPFLVARDGQLVWVRADELTAADWVVETKSLPGDVQYPWMEEDFCWLLGFLFGDGWVVKDKWLSASMGEDETINAKVEHLLNKWFPNARWWHESDESKAYHRTPFGYIRGDSRPVARGLLELGLGGSAKTKRVPDWVFRSPPAFRRAFLRGMCAADGTPMDKTGKARSRDGTKEQATSFRVELANQGLTEDLQRLALTCGVRPGRVLYRSRMAQPPNSASPFLAESWNVSLNFAWVDRAETAPTGAGGGPAYRGRVQTAQTLGPDFRLDKVVSVEPAGREQVWDLTVEGTHAFIADGLAVHNTKKHNDDLYATLGKDPTFRTLLYKAIQIWPDSWEWVEDEHGVVVGARVTGNTVPQVLWPELWPIELLLVKRHSMGSVLFTRENQNEVISDETAPFRLAWLKAALERGSKLKPWACSAEVPADWIVIQAIDPAFVDDAEQAQEGDTDFFVHLSIAVNIHSWRRRLVSGWRDRGLSSNDFKRRARLEAAKYTPPVDGVHEAGALRYIAVENNSLGKMYEINLKRETDFPLVPHSTTSKKADPYEGVHAMASLFENDLFDFALEGADPAFVQLVEAMVNELHGLGSERHDDLCMALWISECVIRRLKAAMESSSAGRRDIARGSIKRGSIKRVESDDPVVAALDPHELRVRPTGS